MKTPLSLLAFFCAANLNAQVQMLQVKESAAVAQASALMSSVGNVQHWIVLLCIATVLGWLLFTRCVATNCRNLDKNANQSYTII